MTDLNLLLLYLSIPIAGIILNIILLIKNEMELKQLELELLMLELQR